MEIQIDLRGELNAIREAPEAASTGCSEIRRAGSSAGLQRSADAASPSTRLAPDDGAGTPDSARRREVTDSTGPATPAELAPEQQRRLDALVA
jgi:hypothetical protein